MDIGRIHDTPVTRSFNDCKVQCQASYDVLERREANRRLAQDNIARARADQKHYADKRRKHAEFKEGDLVMLRAESFDVYKRSNLAEKWRPRYLGPLSVKEVMGPVTYRIELPSSMKRAHNVFHVSKLKRFHRRDDEDGPLNVVIDADGTEEQEVSEIIGKKREKRKMYYLVRFEGDSEEEAIWLPEADLKNCMDLVQIYEKSMRASNSKQR